MFKKALATLAMILCVGMPAAALADATSDANQMWSYRGIPNSAFAFQTTVTAYRDGKKKGPTQTADVYFRTYEAVLVDFTAPSSFKGRRILFEGKRMWLALPSSARTIRVSADDRLMGEASNGDILNIPLERYTVAYGADETVDGSTYKRLVATLKSGATSLYSRVDFLVDRETNKPYRSFHFAKSGKLVKIAEYRKFATIGGSERVTQMVLIDPVVTNRFTVMTFSKYREARLPQSMFSKTSIKSEISG